MQTGALLLAASVLGGLGFLPQLAGPGYEAALAAGLVLPTLAGVASALSAGRHPSPERALLAGLGTGLGLAALGLLTCLLQGLRAGFCDPGEGIVLYLLGPGLGAPLAGLFGALFSVLLGDLPRSARGRGALRALLGLLGPVSGIAMSLLRFYTSPMVYAYDPFFGYFSGPLYDTVLGSLFPFLTYRVGTLATMVFVFAVGALLSRDPNGRLTLSVGHRPLIVASGAIGLVGSVGITLAGTELGHFSTEESIQRALGKSLSEGRCDVVYSRSIRSEDARRLGRECHAHLAQIERFFGTGPTGRVRVLLFASEGEKAALTGAGRTSIAKPWRHEIYLTDSGFPHPVLGHELSHVVAGSFGQGPFRIAGTLSGFLPDPGRIEGFATAASPSESDDLTLEEWAAAMRHLDLLPPLDQLFDLGFFGHNAAQGYVAAGAFVRFLRAERGPEVLRRWYRGEALDLGDLEHRFWDALDRLELTRAALVTAKARFDRPAFFERRCPRVVDRTLRDAWASLSALDLPAARQGFREVLSLDPHDPNAPLGLASCAARSSRLEHAQDAYARIGLSQQAPTWARLSARESRADLLLRQGRFAQARREYTQLSTQVADEDRLRTLDVKRAVSEGISQRALVLLLIGDELGTSWDVAVAKLGEWSAQNPISGLADYLIGRNLIPRGRWREASNYLDRALARELPEPRVRDEALRLRLTVACALGDSAAGEPLLQALRGRSSSRARREGVERFATRCGLD